MANFVARESGKSGRDKMERILGHFDFFFLIPSVRQWASVCLVASLRQCPWTTVRVAFEGIYFRGCSTDVKKLTFVPRFKSNDEENEGGRRRSRPTRESTVATVTTTRTKPWISLHLRTSCPPRRSSRASLKMYAANSESSRKQAAVTKAVLDRRGATIRPWNCTIGWSRWAVLMVIRSGFVTQ